MKKLLKIGKILIGELDLIFFCLLHSPDLVNPQASASSSSHW